MPSPRVYVLTIPIPNWLYESDRSLVYTILRRRSDGPLVVRERNRDASQRSKDWSSRRYSSGRPLIQAVFTDPAALESAQAELRTYVPVLPTGAVRHERRRRYRPDLPCTCVLPCQNVPWLEHMAGTRTPFPSYTQVDACPRHAQFLPGPGAQPLTRLVQQQVLELVQELPSQAGTAVPLFIDEPPSLSGRSDSMHATAYLTAELARGGGKVAQYG